MKLRFISRVVLSLGLLGAWTFAQTANAQVNVGIGNDYGASTVAGSYAQGLSDVITAAGQANLSNSQAANNWEDARSKNFDNHVKYTQTYFEMKRMNKQYRDAERSPPLSSEQLFRIAQQEAPRPLGTGDLDPVTGTLRWPLALRDPAFKPYRDEFNGAFKNRARDPDSFTYSTLMNLQKTAGSWLSDLQAKIGEYRPTDYIQAKKFIESATYELSRS